MQKNHLSRILSFVVVLLLLIACEKEAIQTNAQEVKVLTDSEKAAVYLKTLRTPLPFASLQIDHNTNQVNGFFIDKEAGLRKIEIEDAPYLTMDEITLDNYFMEQIHLKSKLVSSLDPKEVVNYLEETRTLQVQTDFTIEATETTSNIMVFFSENSQGNNHNRDCVGGNRHSIEGTYDKILLAGNGQINYQANSTAEKILVDWLKTVEQSTDN